MEPLEEGNCEIQAGNANILIQGQILSPDGILEGGSLLLDAGGIIRCVGCDCSDSPGFMGATLIRCPEGVVSPGLINAHDHLGFDQNTPGDWGEERYEHRHDWRKGKRGHTRISASGRASNEEVTWTEMRQIMGGATSISGAGEAGGFMRNLDRGNHMEGLGHPEVELDTFPLGDNDGIYRTGDCSYPELPNAGVLNSFWSPHVSEGIDDEARNEFLCLATDLIGGIDVTEARGSFIHAVGLLAMDAASLADSGTSIIWSPRSNISLYGNTAPVTLLDTLGVNIGLGTDWTPSGSINMLRELTCADEMNRNHFNGWFSARQLWEMATINNAIAMGMEEGIGSLAVGLAADIAIFQQIHADPYRSVIEASVADVALVLRSGEALYGDAPLVVGLGGAACEAIPGGVCGVQKQICAQRETNRSFAQLSGANQGSYDLFFCGVPQAEPSCLPFRPLEYEESPSAEDPDGDGLQGDEDNCPNIFNPIRPVDHGVQADHDRDGVGDVCDQSPLGEDQVTDGDYDGDGSADGADNCPFASNADQSDQDGDQMGDLCDACPEDANPNGAGCPASIGQIKRGEMQQGLLVIVEGLIHTVHPDGHFFMQDLPELVEQSHEYSGIYVYTGREGAALGAASGQHIRLEAYINDFYGQIQLSGIQSLDLLARDQALASPQLVDIADLVDPDRAYPLEGIRLRVNDLNVTLINPPAGPGDRDPTEEFIVNDRLVIGDYLFRLDPLPQVGAHFDSITGTLRYSSGAYKLEPSGMRDFAQGPAQLSGIGPEATLIQMDTVGVPQTLGGQRLEVQLSGPADEGGLQINMESSDEAILLVDNINIPAGEISARVEVAALAEGSAEISASIPERGSASVQVRVLGEAPEPEQLILEPESLSLPLNGASNVTLRIDVPAPAGGFRVDLGAAPSEFLEFPISVTIPAGEASVQFLVEAGEEGEGEEITLSAVAGALNAHMRITLTAPTLGVLVINEINYDMPGDETLEYVEIYNASNQNIDLSGWTLQLVNGSNGTQYRSAHLAGLMAAGSYAVMGDAAVQEMLPPAALFFPMPDPDGSGHDIQNGSRDGDGDGVRLLDPEGDSVDSVAYEGPVANTGEGAAALEDPGGDDVQSIGRCPNGADSEDNRADFRLGPLSPGAANSCQ